MKFTLRIFKYLILTVLQIAYAFPAIALIFIIAYVFGHPILDGVNLAGNDSPFALSLIYWFEKFYPQTPVWYPLQGMGVSLLYSYPMSTTMLNIILREIFPMSAVEMFRILSFIEFPLTALGIYLLCWTRLKNQTVGIIAAIFYLLSQASWLFQVLHGIFAQSFSMVFVAPAFIFFDLFISRVFAENKKSALLTRLYFSLTVLAVGLSFYAHIVTGTMISGAIMIWGLLSGLLSIKSLKLFKLLIFNAGKGFILAAIIAGLAEALVGFWSFPFNHYTALANREGLNTRSVEQIQQESLRIPTLLGLRIPGDENYRYDYFFFAAPVLIFFATGTLTAFLLKNKKIQIMAIISIFFVLLTAIPIYLPFIASLFQFFFTAVYFRGLIPAFILLPVVAAWGVYSIPYAITLFPLEIFIKKANREKHVKTAGTLSIMRYALLSVVAVISLGIAYWSINAFKNTPPQNPEKRQFYAYGPGLNKDFEEFFKDPTAYLGKNNKITVNKAGLGGTTTILDSLNENLDLDDKTISDVSPYAAGGAIMQGIGLTETNLKTVNLYHYYASIIHGMWGYQAGQFFGTEKLYKSTKPLGDLTGWFGLKYVMIVPGFDPFNKYEENGWKQLTDYSKKTKNWGFEVWENPEAENLYTVSDRPVVLAIGDYKKGFFDHVFRSANLGALSYKDVWVVEGSKNIDDYSDDQLKQFDGLILHGYSYRFWNRDGAWNMIKKYVENGGNVFVDTGWQYVDRDWGSSSESSSMPDPLPVKRITWSNIGTTWGGVSINPETDIDTDFSLFDPPVWGKDPWGMGLGDAQALRDGSVPILLKDNKVLMAKRDLGRGKIVWSGMNIFTHITTAMNEDEAAFLGEILEPLFTAKPAENYTQISYKRDNPDLAIFTFNSAMDKPEWLLFRESYSPYWQAQLISQGANKGLPVYRAGPGLVLVRLPSVNVGDKLNLEVKLGLVDGLLAKMISILIFVGLLLLIPFGGFMGMLSLAIPRLRVFNKIRGKVSSHVKTITADEEEY